MSTPTNQTLIDDTSCPRVGPPQNLGWDPGFNLQYLIKYPDRNWHIWGWLASAVMVIFIWIVLGHAIIKHLRHYTNPLIQRHKLRVLAYPPVFSALAWVAFLKYGYSTVIMFFAVFFESFAVYNLYTCLQAYLQPYRNEANGKKEMVDTKVFGIKRVKIASKWGLHYRVLTDVMVFQYPVWNIIQAVVSIITEQKGVYCKESYSFKGAHVYMTIINFVSLSIILAALFTYLAVFRNEWKRAQVPAHGLFWCVKGPIMAIFYLGDVTLGLLKTFNVIKGAVGDTGVVWTAAAVENGLYVLVICAVMAVDSVFMHKYYGLGHEDYVQAAGPYPQEVPTRTTVWEAFMDGYLSFLPEFFYKLFFCSIDSVKLVKKRRQLQKRREDAMQSAPLTDDTTYALKNDAYSVDNVNGGSGPYRDASPTENDHGDILFANDSEHFAARTPYQNYGSPGITPSSNQYEYTSSTTPLATSYYSQQAYAEPQSPYYEHQYGQSYPSQSNSMHTHRGYTPQPAHVPQGDRQYNYTSY
ncbi:hypothetical protein BZG36_02096 [Bifiguratus adelaidae]|uniref:Uncharacterized protein n=1 Tax=Bifiguratus adelaidae TaxID=1938954 RepID=A0A261Y3B9_9FUNG|nr:hypothetical protein BZG36_02096 [Bifiguratus adelaidae]